MRLRSPRRSSIMDRQITRRRNVANRAGRRISHRCPQHGGDGRYFLRRRSAVQCSAVQCSAVQCSQAAWRRLRWCQIRGVRCADAGTAGLNDRFGARTSRTGIDFPSAWTMATPGTPRRRQGREPTLVNAISPWAPVFSPWRPALIRSIALAHGTVPILPGMPPGPNHARNLTPTPCSQRAAGARSMPARPAAER
jgi:hypothetical protein